MVEHESSCGPGSRAARGSRRPAAAVPTLKGDAGGLRHALGRLRPTTAAGQQAVVALRRYLQTHVHRLDYGRLRAQGYAVASAAVEGAHHSVVQ